MSVETAESDPRDGDAEETQINGDTVETATVVSSLSGRNQMRA